jgi:hypothetical protein
MDLGLNIRNEFLSTALIVESMTSVFLAKLLGIEDYRNSKVLGNKGGTLSFNQKIDLLIEIGALPLASRTKFQTFMELRNQFMHNVEAKTYESCLGFLNGKDVYLLKTYPQPNNINREKQLNNAATELRNDVGRQTAELINRIQEKIKKEARFDLSEKSNNAFLMSIETMKTLFDDYFEKEIEKKSTFSAKRLKGFGTDLSKILYGLWKKNITALDSDKGSNVFGESGKTEKVRYAKAAE